MHEFKLEKVTKLESGEFRAEGHKGACEILAFGRTEEEAIKKAKRLAR